MVTNKKTGIILVLVGIFWFLISFVLIPDYNPGLGFLWQLNYMATREIVLKEGRWLQLPDGYVPPPSLPSIMPRFNLEPLTPKTTYSDALGMDKMDTFENIVNRIKQKRQRSSEPLDSTFNFEELDKFEDPMPMDQYLQLRDEYDKKYKEYQEKYGEPLKNFTPHYEGRIAIPYKYLFILNITIIFTGLGMLILSSKRLHG